MTRAGRAFWDASSEAASGAATADVGFSPFAAVTAGVDSSPFAAGAPQAVKKQAVSTNARTAEKTRFLSPISPSEKIVIS